MIPRTDTPYRLYQNELGYTKNGSSHLVCSTSPKMSWSGSACECHPTIVDSPWWTSSRSLFQGTFLKVAHRGGAKRPFLAPIIHDALGLVPGWPEVVLWYRAIAEYSKLHLTYPSDRLYALAGIATDIYLRTGYSSIHGLWVESLLVD